MFDIDLSRSSGRAVLRFVGAIEGADDRDLLHEAFTFIQPDDHLVLDMSKVRSLDAIAAVDLHDIIQTRGPAAETVVVSTSESVSMALVLHNIDRVAPIVPDVPYAVALLDQWAAGTSDRPTVCMPR